MTELVKYEAARRALAEAVAVDEVKQIHDQAEALRYAARIAGDKQLEIQAAQIRFRAERRFGELMAAQRAAGKVARGGRPRSEKTPNELSGVSGEANPLPEITLRDIGVDYRFSSRAQKLAELPAEKFESLIDRHAEEMRSGSGRVAMDLLKIGAEEDGRERRRALQQALSDETAKLPTGRRFPVVYADPPWHRKQGVTGRSYENHYPTMTWDDICALPVRDLLLPDAWVFLWIPRAHMFALHPVDMEFADDDGRVITRKVMLPLAWAVARAWGCDSYSTAFVWTKTDEEHPEDQGGGVITFDQDEILLLFKRGRGLPKPDTKEKFGSNHRERSKPLGHSRKPEFYREMIATMCGGLPVMELFARVDTEHPLPPRWEGWGNQTESATIDNEIAETIAPGSTADESSAGGAALAPAASPTIFADDGLDIPSFLRRTKSTEGKAGLAGGLRPLPAAGQNDRRDAARNSSDGGVESRHAGEPELPSGILGNPDQAADTTAEQSPAAGDPVAAAGVAPSPSDPDEFTILRTFSNFAMPDRRAICEPREADYIARGLVFKYGAVDDWSLTASGWNRLEELKRERTGIGPEVLTAPAIADLSDDEQDMREVLAAIAGANRCVLSVTAREAFERDLIGLGYLEVTDDRGGLAVTEAGRAWLRATEPASGSPLTEPDPPSPVQLTIFGAA
jgi:N6-adenosine-specific RNA methylase IME4